MEIFNFQKLAYFLQTDKPFNYSAIIFPQTNPELICLRDPFTILGRNGKKLSPENPKIKLFAYLKGNEKGKELEDILKNYFEVKLEQSELETFIRTVAVFNLAKSGKIHLKTLDLDIYTRENEFFLDIGFVKGSLLPEERGGQSCMSYITLSESKEEYKFVSTWYENRNNPLENTIIRSHEETHAMLHLNLDEKFKEEFCKFAGEDEKSILDEFDNSDVELKADYGVALAIKKRLPDLDMAKYLRILKENKLKSKTL